MIVKQISIMVANKSGELAVATDFLARCGINLRALSIADTPSYGILRIIVDKAEEAESLLKKGGYTVKTTEVLAVPVEDKPGGLAERVSKLSEEGIGIEYAYAYPSNEQGKVYMVFRVDDNAKAEKILS